VQDKKFIVPFELGNRGTIGKLFVYFFYAPMYNLMVFLLYFFGNSLGWAIISITIIIRILLLYPQHSMLVSQKKLQAIQPKIKEIQEKYKGDSQKLGIELMNLYKTEKVNPVGSCGPLLIQLPILLVIYNVIISIGDISNSYYLYSFFSHFQVSQIVTNFYGVNLLST
jgi:YidC/Oxa1 family membrane protein insertase